MRAVDTGVSRDTSDIDDRHSGAPEQPVDVAPVRGDDHCTAVKRRGDDARADDVACPRHSEQRTRAVCALFVEHKRVASP